MKEMKRLVLFLMLMSVTACAPVVYDSTYQERRDRVDHSSRYSAYTRTSHLYEAPYRSSYYPIEVTLYAGNVYSGIQFKPVHHLFYDGDYVQIPVKSRRGGYKKIFAHYHRGSLHFDSDRNCRVIHGSSRFVYDKRWDKGHHYSHISAGDDYDLTGLKLKIHKSTKRSIGNAASNKGRHSSSESEYRRYEHGLKNIHHVKAEKNRVIKEVYVHKDNNKGERHTINLSKAQSRREARSNAAHNNDLETRYVHNLQGSGNISDEKPILFDRLKINSSNSGQANIAKTRHVADRDIRKNVNKKGGMADGKKVRVTLAGGSLVVKGEEVVLKSAGLTLKDGESRKLTLIANGGRRVALPIFYKDGLLVINRVDQFKKNPSWVNGKSFKINTAEDSRLKNIKLTVVAL